MDRDRRNFLKKSAKTAFIFTGSVFVPATGIWRPSEAFWQAQTISAGGAVTLWPDWSETDLTLATDNIWVVLYNNTSAGGNETGSGGGLSGNDLIVLQSGNIAGAAGSPLSRNMDDSDDVFSFQTAGACDALLKSQSVWQFIMKAKNIVGAGNLVYLWEANNSIELYIDANEKLDAKIETDGVARVNAMTTDGGDGSSDYYIFAGTDGSSSYGGFKSGAKPTKWSDFAANDRVSNADAGTFLQTFGTLNLLSGASRIGCDAYFSAFSNTAAFIDLAA